MQIVVCGVFGESYPLEVEPSDTIKKVKNKLEIINNVFAPGLKFLFPGGVMDDYCILADHNVQKNSKLHILILSWYRLENPRCLKCLSKINEKMLGG